jgi:hypothetical protein
VWKINISQNDKRIKNISSCFSTDALFPNKNAANGDSDPLAIKSCFSYAINCSEVYNIHESTLKITTGGDDIDKRAIRCNDYKNLNQYSFASGACNTLPIMTMPDEAAKERMIIIPFLYQIVSKSDFDNPLVLKIRNELLAPEFEIKIMSYHFSNILYAAFILYKENEIVTAVSYDKDNCCLEIKNEIDKFMCQNNYL